MFSQVVVGQARGCNTNTPGWGSSIGIVSFATDQIWTVGSQTWSDAVTATACNKINFGGGNFRKRNFNADCRSNPDYSGDLFSWCAVVRFQNELCPPPWRIPTRQDFIDLEIAINSLMRWQRTYVKGVDSDWGEEYGGNSTMTGKLENQKLLAYYWSQTEISTKYAYSLHIEYNYNPNSHIRPKQGSIVKDLGFALRCVR